MWAGEGQATESSQAGRTFWIKFGVEGSEETDQGDTSAWHYATVNDYPERRRGKDRG